VRAHRSVTTLRASFHNSPRTNGARSEAVSNVVQPNPATVEALLDTTWRMVAAETARTDGLDRKAATLATFASLLASLTATLGGQLTGSVEQLWAFGLDGYLLDALERLDGKPAQAAAVDAFVARAETAERRRGPSPGLGEDFRLRAPGVVGSGLEVDGETVQLSAFTSQRPRPRITRPASRR